VLPKAADLQMKFFSIHDFVKFFKIFDFANFFKQMLAKFEKKNCQILTNDFAKL